MQEARLDNSLPQKEGGAPNSDRSVFPRPGSVQECSSSSDCASRIRLASALIRVERCSSLYKSA
jgi:hypothetical protein